MRNAAKGVGAFLALGSASAFAALPTGVATAYTTASTDFGDLMDLAWPLIITVSVAFLMVKFYKRTTSKV